MSLVIDRIQEHYNYASKNISSQNIIGIFLVGSQNYGTDTPNSDVDTKLLITPTLLDIYTNKTGESTTLHMPESNEQISIKDIRCFFQELRKQNINILELLFTEYCIINEPYKSAWSNLIHERERIAHYDPIRAIKAMKGTIYNTYDRIYTKDGTINRKQVGNLVRYEEFIKKYIEGAPYEKCLRPEGDVKDYIMNIRTGDMGEGSLKLIADSSMKAINILINAYEQRSDINRGDEFVDELFLQTAKEIIDASFFMEYSRNGEL